MSDVPPVAVVASAHGADRSHELDVVRLDDEARTAPDRSAAAALLVAVGQTSLSER